LKRNYPFFLIPKLVGKNPLSKIITYDNNFYNNRRSQLTYFLNFINKHNKLRETREFTKFLNDPEFDNEYFKKDDSIFRFPESEKLTDNVTSKIYGVFSNFFSKAEEIVHQSQNENKIKEISVFYNKIFDNLKEIKKAIVSYFDISPHILILSKELAIISQILKITSSTSKMFHLKRIIQKNIL
jgi:hypothetical protein